MSDSRADALDFDTALPPDAVADRLERGARDVRGARLPARLADAGITSVQVRRAAPADRSRYRVGLNGWERRVGANWGLLCEAVIAPAPAGGSRVVLRLGVGRAAPWSLPVPPLVIAVATAATGGAWREGLLLAGVLGAGGLAMLAWQNASIVRRYGPGVAALLRAVVADPAPELAAT